MVTTSVGPRASALVRPMANPSASIGGRRSYMVSRELSLNFWVEVDEPVLTLPGCRQGNGIRRWVSMSDHHAIFSQEANRTP